VDLHLDMDLPKKRHVAAIATIALAAVAVYYFAMVLPKGELEAKKPYATLQGIESSRRADADTSSPVLLENVSGYAVLGIPTGDAEHPRAWLILNASSKSGSVWILPRDVPLNLQCSYLSELQGRDVDPKVRAFLRKNCRDG